MAATIISTVIGVILGALVTYWLMKKDREDKRLIAIKALLLEFQKNSKYIDDILDFIDQGAHTGKQGHYSWTWNTPYTEAYQEHLVFACEDDPNLTKEIIAFYTQIEGIKVITQYIQNLMASSVTERSTSILKANASKAEVIQRNKEIGDICRKLKTPTTELIQKLNAKLSLRKK